MPKNLKGRIGVLLLATVGAVLPTTMLAAPAEAATCTTVQTPWAYSYFPGVYVGFDNESDEDTKVGGAIRYRKCIQSDGDVMLRATQIGGRFALRKVATDCDAWNGGLVAAWVNFDNRAEDLIVGYNPPPLRVDCDEDGENVRWVDISAETTSIDRREVDTWRTWYEDLKLEVNNNNDHEASRWGHLYEA